MQPLMLGLTAAIVVLDIRLDESTSHELATV